MTQDPARAIFFGTPSFALPVLKALRSLHSDIHLLAVVTIPDRPAGRGQKIQPSSIKVWSAANGIPVLQPEKLTDPDFIAQVQELHPTLGVIAAYGKIIPALVLTLFPKGVLNVHPSLLPRWRGPSPVQAAIAAGDEQTGVTIILTTDGMDEGPILAQEHLLLTHTETAEDLQADLFSRGAILLRGVLPKWLLGNLEPYEQDKKNVVYSHLLKREDGRAVWNQAGTAFLRLFRAYQPWPGLFMLLPDGTRVKILSATFLPDAAALPGTVRGSSEAFQVAAADGWINLQKVQPEGKHAMSGKDFLQGHSELRGKALQ